MSSFLSVITKLASRAALSVGTSPRTSQAFCVATPVGQWPVWHRCAWMHPMAIIASRATAIMSAPRQNANNDVSGRPSLPEPNQTTSW